MVCSFFSRAIGIVKTIKSRAQILLKTLYKVFINIAQERTELSLKKYFFEIQCQSLDGTYKQPWLTKVKNVLTDSAVFLFMHNMKTYSFHIHYDE